MIFLRKTVRETLEGTGWDKLAKNDDNFHEFLKKYGNYTCKFPATIKRNVTFYDLYEKSRHGWQFCVFQKGKTFDLNAMDPFADALCLGYTRSYDHQVTIFEYDQEPFSETILLQNLAILFMHFNDYNIFNMDGSILDIENKEELLFWNAGLVAISKKSLSGPWQDDSKEREFHIVMRYLCPTAQCILANRKHR